jgi:hypothetical protein
MKPCAFYDWDDAADRDRLAHPTDNCDMQCATCGFNPAVMDKRLAEWRRAWQEKNLYRSGKSA